MFLDSAWLEPIDARSSVKQVMALAMGTGLLWRAELKTEAQSGRSGGPSAWGNRRLLVPGQHLNKADFQFDLLFDSGGGSHVIPETLENFEWNTRNYFPEYILLDNSSFHFEIN
jgi:hypothetical protein